MEILFIDVRGVWREGSIRRGGRYSKEVKNHCSRPELHFVVVVRGKSPAFTGLSYIKLDASVTGGCLFMCSTDKLNYVMNVVQVYLQ